MYRNIMAAVLDALHSSLWLKVLPRYNKIPIPIPIQLASAVAALLDI